MRVYFDFKISEYEKKMGQTGTIKGWLLEVFISLTLFGLKSEVNVKNIFLK